MAEVKATSRADEKQFITSTDVPVIVGASPWEDALTLWRRKKGLLPPREETPAMRLGKRLEEAVFKEVKKLLPINWEYCPGELFVSEDFEFCACHTDAVSFKKGTKKPEAILEIKSTSLNIERFEKELLTDVYFFQICHQLLCTGAEVCYIAVVPEGGKGKIEIYNLKWKDYKDWYRGEVVPLLREFWESLDKDTPPAWVIEGRANSVKALRPGEHIVEFEINDIGKAGRIAGYLKFLAMLEAEKKQIEQNIQKIKDVFIAALGGEGVVRFNQVLLYEVKKISQRRLDTGKLKAEKPDVYDAYCTETHQTRFVHYGHKPELKMLAGNLADNVKALPPIEEIEKILEELRKNQKV